MLLGPLAVEELYQGKGFSIIIVKKGLEIAKIKNENIFLYS
jgi:predicted N-acetyltransferase YhbS